MANNGLARRANGKWLFEFLTASTCHPGQFWSKPCDMLCFFLDKTARNKHREVGIEHSGFLEAVIHVSLYMFPDGIAIRSNDHTAAHRRVVGQFRLTHYLVVPL